MTDDTTNGFLQVLRNLATTGTRGVSRGAAILDRFHRLLHTALGTAGDTTTWYSLDLLKTALSEELSRRKKDPGET